MASFRPTEYEYTVSYFETIELLATMSKRISREMDMMKRKALIQEYIPFYIAYRKEYAKMNIHSPIARAIRKKRYGEEYGRHFPNFYCPYSEMTNEQRKEIF